MYNFFYNKSCRSTPSLSFLMLCTTAQLKLVLRGYMYSYRPLIGWWPFTDGGHRQTNVVPHGDNWMKLPSAYVTSTESLSYKTYCTACWELAVSVELVISDNSHNSSMLWWCVNNDTATTVGTEHLSGQNWMQRKTPKSIMVHPLQETEFSLNCTRTGVAHI